jgi:hypothetical protein
MLFENTLSPTIVFKWHSCFKARKCWRNLRTHPRRLSPNNPRGCRHWWDNLGSLPHLNRKSEHAPHCHELCSPTLWQND